MKTIASYRLAKSSSRSPSQRHVRATLHVLSALCLLLHGDDNLLGQQALPWRSPVNADVEASSNLNASLRVVVRKSVSVSRNIIELKDIADITGPANSVERLQSLLLGIAPRSGEISQWSHDDLKSILALHGWDTQQIRWDGASSCNVSFSNAAEVKEPVETFRRQPDSRSLNQAERMVSSMIAGYLQTQTGSNSFWRITPRLPNDYLEMLSDRRSIAGITGGKEPWTGPQQFILRLQSPSGPDDLVVEADIELPPVVVVATGPLAKGRVLVPSDLKLVRLTPAMRVDEENCVLDAQQILGRELRKNLSSGQPVQRADTGPPRLIQIKDLVTIQVISGSIVAETTGRALQSGGLDEVIEVEVMETKKRLASRIVDHGKVEVIAR